MIEVFKTNVKDKSQSTLMVDLIHKTFPGYTANFDLDDRDRILRICGLTNPLQAFQIINLLKDFGVQAEVLPDEVQSHFTVETERSRAGQKITFLRS